MKVKIGTIANELRIVCDKKGIEPAGYDELVKRSERIAKELDEAGVNSSALITRKPVGVYGITTNLVIDTSLLSELLSEESVDVRVEVIHRINRITAKVMYTYEQRRVQEELAGPGLEEYEVINAHGFTSNRMFEAKDGTYKHLRKKSDDGLKKGDYYLDWLNKFPKHKLKNQEYWEERGVDFDKPLHLRLGFVHMKENPNPRVEGLFDMANFEKAFMDQLLNEKHGAIKIDDSCVVKLTKETIAYCDSYETGKIYYHLSNYEGGK